MKRMMEGRKKSYGGWEVMCEEQERERIGVWLGSLLLRAGRGEMGWRPELGDGVVVGGKEGRL